MKKGLLKYIEDEVIPRYEAFDKAHQVEHMREKYDVGGYLKLWIPESPNAERLSAFREELKNPELIRSKFDEMFAEVNQSLKILVTKVGIVSEKTIGSIVKEGDKLISLTCR